MVSTINAYFMALIFKKQRKLRHLYIYVRIFIFILIYLYWKCNFLSDPQTHAKLHAAFFCSAKYLNVFKILKFAVCWPKYHVAALTLFSLYSCFILKRHTGCCVIRFSHVWLFVWFSAAVHTGALCLILRAARLRVYYARVLRSWWKCESAEEWLCSAPHTLNTAQLGHAFTSPQRSNKLL